jgi:hypothetical protein
VRIPVGFGHEMRFVSKTAVPPPRQSGTAAAILLLHRFLVQRGAGQREHLD